MTVLTSMTAWTDHPFAALVPPMTPGEFAALCADIAKEGLHEPIVLYENKILLGRERYRACVKTGTEPRFREYEGDDPVGYVISSDVLRRHLSPSQKAVVALAVERVYASEAKQRQRDAGRSFGEGHPKQEVRAIVPEALVARDKAAAAIGISPRLVSDAKLVEREAPDLLAEISLGALTISKAKREIRRREKLRRVAEIASQTPAPITSLGPFPVLYADPPWRYEHADPTRAIENHYPTMDLDEIKALKVPACDNSILFLWTPNPMLQKAIEVMNAWGFDYRTCMAWVKPGIGMGWWVRQQHEQLLIGVRGDLRCPDPEDRPSSVVMAPRTEHSVKPPEFYSLIERMYPLASRVELFARAPRDNWARWGNEV
jgi:N6-adenosine-specific RNA methylase IME4